VRVLLVCALLLAITGRAHADEGEAWDGSTIAEQAGAGFGVGVGVGAIGSFAGLLAGAGFAENGDWGTPLIGALVGFGVGFLVGDVAGVQLVGDKNGGDGSLLATTAGLVGGIAVAAIYVAITERAGRRPPITVDLLVALTCILGGPITGYQLTF